MLQAIGEAGSRADIDVMGEDTFQLLSCWQRQGKLLLSECAGWTAESGLRGPFFEEDIDHMYGPGRDRHTSSGESGDKRGFSLTSR